MLNGRATPSVIIGADGRVWPVVPGPQFAGPSPPILAPPHPSAPGPPGCPLPPLPPVSPAARAAALSRCSRPLPPLLVGRERRHKKKGPPAGAFVVRAFWTGAFLKKMPQTQSPCPPAPSSSLRASPTCPPRHHTTPILPLLRERRRLWGGRHLHREAPSPSGSQSR